MIMIMPIFNIVIVILHHILPTMALMEYIYISIFIHIHVCIYIYIHVKTNNGIKETMMINFNDGYIIATESTASGCCFIQPCK